MGSDNVFERLWKQELSVRKLVLDGKRDPEEVSSILQMIIAGKKIVEEVPNLSDWPLFYKEVFGLDLDFSKVVIPERKPGFTRLLVLAQGMTPQRLFDKCKELFPSWKYTEDNLDKVITSDRTAKDGPYAIWVRDRQEADEENKNLSADDLAKRGIPGITLEERLLYELKFFKETGKHLDVSNYTLCSGSRFSDGHVPDAYWSGDRLRVYWNYTNNHYDYLRARSVVS